MVAILLWMVEMQNCSLGAGIRILTATSSSHFTDVKFTVILAIITASLDGFERAFETRRYRNFREIVVPMRTQCGCVRWHINLETLSLRE